MPGDFRVARPFIYVAGTPIDPNQNNPNENTVYSAHNNSMEAVTGHSHSGIPGDGGPITLAVPQIPPIGTILPFYDFGLLTFNPAIWHYCDGSAQVVSGIGLQTLPDLSGRYLVGFGTDGGGNIGTVPFVAGAVGNAGSVINFQHTHTENPHTHTLPANTDAGGAVATGGPSIDSTDNSGSGNTGNESATHVHNPGTLQFQTGDTHDGGGAQTYFSMFDSGGTLVDVLRGLSTVAGGTGTLANFFGAGMYTQFFTANGTGATGTESATHTHITPNHQHTLSGHTHTAASHTHPITGPSGLQSDSGMSNALSSTQDIRPRSIPVRFIMRIT